MNRYVLSALAVVLCLAPSLHASPLSGPNSHLFHRNPGAAAAPQQVYLVLDSQVAVERKVQIGDTIYRLRPGMIQRFHVPVGTPVIARSAMGSHAPGQLMFIAKPEISGQRIVID